MSTTTTTKAKDPTWPELLGSNNWTNLLNPLHLSLRLLILQCGDLCQATYDAFIEDQGSKFCGSSRYGKSSFFQKVMFQPSLPTTATGAASDLFVSSFLYATARVSVPEAFLLHSLSRESWDRESNWIGYVSVTSDATTRASGRREIYIAWRGTTRDFEWVNVLGADLESIEPLLKSEAPITKSTTIVGEAGEGGKTDSGSDVDDGVPKVMRGWLTMYTSDDPKSQFTKLSAQAQLRKIIKQLMDEYKEEEVSIIFTGHSLGASLSVISAFDIVRNVVSDKTLVSAFVFGCPQVGNKSFNKYIKSFNNLTILHVKNTIDLIPHYPGRLLGFTKTGTELVIDTRRSPKLKDSKNPSDWHNLQAMLHVVAGWDGEEGEFEVKVKRSLALVNKSCGFLREEELVPESWWVEKNKGMVRPEEDGEWVLASPADEDLPVPEF